METPHVVVYDSDLNVESISERIGMFFRQWPDLWDGEAADVPATVTEFVRGLAARSESERGVLTALLRPTLIVDVVQTPHAVGAAVLATFEKFEVRDPVGVAAKRFELTAREQDVVTLLLMGMGATEVARRLGLSELTVHDYYARLRRKTGARTLSGMIATLLGWSDAEPSYGS
ncbi:MAG: Bacterial regulatory protein luxR family [Candidatus Eremiobacteraeota bacterium]|nr:Bacterial regulatory protein luxR family [Candidatus Eremiobacteraeota bacterium]